jgi:uncharacterized protein
MRRIVTAAAMLGTILTAGTASADFNYQPLPFVQTWSNTGQIQFNDDWFLPGVPGIVGYLGDDPLSTTTNVNACAPSILADPPSSQDVIANQVNPAITNGGVAEFEIANPVVALQGSGTADFPNLRLHLNTTGYQGIIVSGVLRDIDPTADAAVQQIAIQYRVNTVAWTCLQLFPDVTGPGDVQTTPFNIPLPNDADNQAQVQVRFLTTNAGGNDEWVGIDDIIVTGTLLPVPTLPTTWGAVKARAN